MYFCRQVFFGRRSATAVVFLVVGLSVCFVLLLAKRLGRRCFKPGEFQTLFQISLAWLQQQRVQGEIGDMLRFSQPAQISVQSDQVCTYTAVRSWCTVCVFCVGPQSECGLWRKGACNVPSDRPSYGSKILTGASWLVSLTSWGVSTSWSSFTKI